MILCDDVRVDLDHPHCTHIDCLMSHIVSLESPAFPLLREMICVYLVLTECQGKGTVQVRIEYEDEERDRQLFGTPVHAVDFTTVSPLDTIGIPFRIRDCLFRKPGQCSIQFWYNGAKVEERPLQLRGVP
jgi:hypothetical protein